MNSPLISSIKKYGEIKSFQKNDVIMNDRSYIRSIPIVVKGSIKVMQIDEELRELFLYYIKPGETCIMSFLGGIHNQQSPIKAIAETDCEVLLIPTENATQLIREFPEWVEYIFKVYHKRFEELLEVVNEVSFKKMDERLMQFLERKADVSDKRILNITHEEIANELGSSRVVISRLLKQLEKEELIKLGRNKITLM